MSKKTYAEVVFIAGSDNDDEHFNASQAPEVLDACGITWEYSVGSAHRHGEPVTDYVRDRFAEGTRIFGAAAGLAGALPGHVAAALNNLCLVFGIPIAGGEWQGMDALSAMQSLPAGTVVSVEKFGKHGFTHAAIQAAQALGMHDPEILAKLDAWLKAQAAKKPSEFRKRRSPLLEE